MLCYPRVTHVYADEGQNTDPNWWDCGENLAEELSKSTVMFPEENIHNKDTKLKYSKALTRHEKISSININRPLHRAVFGTAA